MSARTRVPSRLSNTGGSRGLTARLCFPSSHVRATDCSTSLSSVLELGSAAWCSQWRPFSSQRCGDSRRISRKRLSKLAWMMLPPWPTTLGHHWLNCGRGDSAWNLWERRAIPAVLESWIQTWLRVVLWLVSDYHSYLLAITIPIVSLPFSCSHLFFCVLLSPSVRRPSVGLDCLCFTQWTRELFPTQLRTGAVRSGKQPNRKRVKTATKAESGNLGEVLGSVVSVETQLHVEEHPGMALPTNLPAKLQLSSSVKSDERVDESSVPRSRKNRARSSVVLCPGGAATPNPLTSSAGSAAQIDTPVPPDVLLLYWTLVSDNAVPTGYEREFATLETSIQKASESALRLSTRMNNMTSAVWLHQREEKLNSTFRLKKLSEDQFLLAAQTRPTRFRAKWQQSYYDGPTARRDAEEALRSKWVETLAFSPERHTDTLWEIF